MQGVVTGVLCYLLMVMLPDLQVEADFEVYAGVVAALAGLIIGLIIIVFVRKRFENTVRSDADVDHVVEGTR